LNELVSNQPSRLEQEEDFFGRYAGLSSSLLWLETDSEESQHILALECGSIHFLYGQEFRGYNSKKTAMLRGRIHAWREASTSRANP